MINLKVVKLKARIVGGNVGTPDTVCRMEDGLWLWCPAAQLWFQDGATDILLHTAPASG